MQITLIWMLQFRVGFEVTTMHIGGYLRLMLGLLGHRAFAQSFQFWVGRLRLLAVGSVVTAGRPDPA
jgi:hypothetical protein